MPNAKVLAKKQEDAKNLKEKFDKSKLVILADYRGINVEDITKMRAELRKTDCEYIVAKNSTLRFAVKDSDIEGISEYLEGPTAVTFSYDDYVAPAKVLYDYAEKSDFYKIKAGIMDGKVISADEIIKLAKLPSKEMLLTQLATVLLANIRNLAVVLDQAREKQEENA
ncbi:MAG: 50S ribosomal protein L10 [Clostridia bacterium]|nr:50S ribosomal protein L10 [Clostridia bacterium]